MSVHPLVSFLQWALVRAGGGFPEEVTTELFSKSAHCPTAGSDITAAEEGDAGGGLSLEEGAWVD